MLVPDVNVLVSAKRRDVEQHPQASAWLVAALNGQEPVGLSELVLSGAIRVLTNRRVFRQPETPDDALTFCSELLASPAAVPLRPGMRHWGIFTGLCGEVGARGNVVPDAYHAALAMENDATFITFDAGFRRFASLRTARPALA